MSEMAVPVFSTSPISSHSRRVSFSDPLEIPEREPSPFVDLTDAIEENVCANEANAMLPTITKPSSPIQASAPPQEPVQQPSQAASQYTPCKTSSIIGGTSTKATSPPPQPGPAPCPRPAATHSRRNSRRRPSYIEPAILASITNNDQTPRSAIHTRHPSLPLFQTQPQGAWGDIMNSTAYSSATQPTPLPISPRTWTPGHSRKPSRSLSVGGPIAFSSLYPSTHTYQPPSPPSLVEMDDENEHDADTSASASPSPSPTTDRARVTSEDQPDGLHDLSNPPGYQQDHQTSFSDRPVEDVQSKPTAHAPSPTRGKGQGLLDSDPFIYGSGHDIKGMVDEDSPLWDQALAWAKNAGKRLSVTEANVWRAISGRSE